MKLFAVKKNAVLKSLTLAALVPCLSAMAGRTISAGSALQGGGCEIIVGPGDDVQGVYALYGSREPDSTEMWEHVAYLGEVEKIGGTFAFAPQGDWSAVRFAVGRFYVRDGLIAHWDGIWNQRSGHHGKTNEPWPWENLTTNAYDFTMKPGETEWPLVSDRSMTFNTGTGYGLLSTDDTTATFGAVAAAGGTMELSLSVNATFQDWAMTVLRSSQASNLAFGMNYLGAFAQGNDPYGPMMSNCKGSNLKNAATVAFAYSAVTKLPTAGYFNGADITFGSTQAGVATSGFEAGETVVGRLRVDSATDGNRVAYRGDIHAIRLYSRALTKQEAAYNSATDKLRFLGDAATLTIMKEGAAESITPVHRKHSTIPLSVTGTPIVSKSGKIRYSSYAVTVGAGAIDSELWMFYGHATPANELDFTGWEHAEKIADVTTAGGQWNVPAPGDSAWRSTPYAVRFALIGKYVATGLLGRWDAINNTRSGHADTLTALENLVGTGPDFTLNGTIGVTSSALSFSGQAGCFAYMTAADFRAFAPWVEDTTLTFEATFKMRPGVNDDTNQAIFNGTGTWQGGGNDSIPYAVCSLNDNRGLCIATETNGDKGKTYLSVQRTELQSLSTVAVGYYQRYGTFWAGAVSLNGSHASPDGPDNNTAGGELVTIGVRKYGNTVADQMSFAGDFHSLRIYRYNLSVDERAHNAALDQIRFGAGGAPSTAAGDTVSAYSGIVLSAEDPTGIMIIVR